jgi:hypothetical protein
MYPEAEDIVKALQDGGEAVVTKQKGKEVTRTKFPLLEKLSLKIYNAIKNDLYWRDNTTEISSSCHKWLGRSMRRNSSSFLDPTLPIGKET